MSEPGSDELLFQVASQEQVVRPAELEQARSLEEERRLSTIFRPEASQHEPGIQYPDPDEAPPPAGRPEFDPLPPG